MRINIYITFILLILVQSDKNKKKKSNKPQNQNITKESELEIINNWAKKNNIYINDKITLNKNTDSSHNFYYFTSNSQIPNNTLLLKVPYDMMITQFSLNEIYKNSKFIRKAFSIKKKQKIRIFMG